MYSLIYGGIFDLCISLSFPDLPESSDIWFYAVHNQPVQTQNVQRLCKHFLIFTHRGLYFCLNSRAVN